MGRAPCCSKVGLHRGAWSSDEDKLLINHIQTHGEGQWRSLPSKAGLLRCGKSCRLRWMNYLRPGIKRGNFTSDENDAIIRLHSLHGSRWSLIATELSGRTDNEIKNHWNAHLRKTVENADDHQQKTPRNKRSTKKKTEEKTMEVYKHSDSASSSSSSSFLLSDLSSSTIDLEDGDFEFSWLNSWEPCFDGQKDDGFVMDGCDLVKGDENLVFEQLYHEYLNLLNDEDVSESIDELKNKNSVNG